MNENNESNNTNIQIKQIEHLVIAGGGPTVFNIYGILQELDQNRKLRKTIKSIHGTSAGALAGAIFCLNYDWEILNDYIIHRPWHQLFTVNMDVVLSSYLKCGFWNINIFYDSLKPLLEAKDLDPNITLAELYEYSGIDLHCYCVNVNDFVLCDIHHQSHPHWTLVEAIYASCAIPSLFSPLFKDGISYCDGGVMMNYPLEPCLKSGIDQSTILGINNHFETNTIQIDESTNLFQYVFSIMQKTFKHVITNQAKQRIDNEIYIHCNDMSLDYFTSALQNHEKRQQLVNEGKELAKSIQCQCHELVQG
jgi:predicted acylesterase/phospholipase RssA